MYVQCHIELVYMLVSIIGNKAEVLNYCLETGLSIYLMKIYVCRKHATDQLLSLTFHNKFLYIIFTNQFIYLFISASCYELSASSIAISYIHIYIHVAHHRNKCCTICKQRICSLYFYTYHIIFFLPVRIYLFLE